MTYFPHDIQRQGIRRIIHTGHQALCHAHDLGVNYQLLQAEAALKVQHTGSRHHVDTR